MSERCTSQSLSSGQQCRLRTRELARPTGEGCQSTPTCWIHLRSGSGMRVMKSTIDDAGKGLFVTKNIPAGANLGEFTGRTRPASAPWTPYDLALNNGRKVDASDPLQSSVLRFANHKPFAEANAMIVDRDRGTARNGCRMIRSRRAIKATPKEPKEVFIDYGQDYWRRHRAAAQASRPPSRASRAAASGARPPARAAPPAPPPARAPAAQAAPPARPAAQAAPPARPAARPPVAIPAVPAPRPRPPSRPSSGGPHVPFALASSSSATPRQLRALMLAHRRS